jgi:hypothetical protein
MSPHIRGLTMLMEAGFLLGHDEWDYRDYLLKLNVNG